MNAKRRYPIVGSQWYSEQMCFSIAKLLGVANDPRKLRAGAWGINLARAIDPKGELTVLVVKL